MSEWDPWVEWNGGECPVDPRTVVDVQYDDMETEVAIAGTLAWGHKGVARNNLPRIVRYTVISECKDSKTPTARDETGVFEQKTVEQLPKKAAETQVGGDHYKKLAIQPIEYCHKNGLGPCESFVVKYVTRYKDKNGKEDLLKAIHCIELLIEMEYGE